LLNAPKGYHVQITARSERDLTPESIVQKVSDASGSKYSGSSTPSNSGPPPPVSSKPAFNPTRSSGAAGAFNPLASRNRTGPSRDQNVDEDGWGQDAPQVTRTQLEKVQSAYQPTKVNMKELTSQKPEPSRFNGTGDNHQENASDVVRGGYQPVGKVDISALRRQAQGSGNTKDDRPETVKGAYEPVGKVDITALRARAQAPAGSAASPPGKMSPSATGTSTRSSEPEEQRSLPDRSAPFQSSERLTTLPKPKVANRFGAGASNFTGTKAPTPGGFGLESTQKPAAPPVGISKSFADHGGKTPAQQWAEKRARERGLSGATENQPAAFGAPSPMKSQTSGGGEWKSGYTGKSWAPVGTTRTGPSAGSMEQQRTGPHEESEEQTLASPAGGISSIRDRFKGAPPMGAANIGDSRSPPSPPPLDTSNKPNASRGVPIPGPPQRPQQLPQEEEEEEEREAPRMPTPPPQPPRSPTPPTPPAVSGSPIRLAMPVGRGQAPTEIEDAREEQFSPPPSMPARSLAAQVPHEDDLSDDTPHYDPARGAGQAAAVASFGEEAAERAEPHAPASDGGKRALVQYDYEKAEDNELELREGEYVTDIDMVDEDWWMGRNAHGETGLFPAAYVELAEEEEHHGGAAPAPTAGISHESDLQAHAGVTQGHTATALYDYEAAEGNELTFPEDAKITNVVCTPFLESPELMLRVCDRNFQTKTGGVVSTTGRAGCSQRLMSSWTSEASAERNVSLKL